MTGKKCKVSDNGRTFREFIDLKTLDATATRKSSTVAIKPEKAATRNVKYEIIIPMADNSKKNVIRVDELRDLVKEMSDHFGGVTMTPRQYGCDNTGTCDEVASMYSIRFDSDDTMIKNDKGWMEEFAKKVGERFGQSSVLIVTDVLDYSTKYVKTGEPKQELPGDIVEKSDDFFHAVRS
jgi:hypothetical protein